MHGSSLTPGEVGAASPFSPTITPVGTPRELIPPAGPLPYDGNADLEKAIRMAMKNRDTAAWKLLIKARTVRNNLPTSGENACISVADAARGGEELRPALTKLGWTENEVNWAQAKADGDLVEGIKLLLKEETSTHHHSNSDGGGEDDQEENKDDDEQHNQLHEQLNGSGSSHQQQNRRRGKSVSEGGEVAVTSSILRRLSIDSTWQLLQSTSRTTGDEAARRKAWMKNALLLVQVSSLQRQGRLSLLVKKKMKIAVAHGLQKEVEALLKVVHQRQARHRRDSVDREDSLFTSYKCPLTDDLLYEPVTLVCGHTFSKRALEGVLSSGNRACPICRKPISVADADELKVNILMRDTITRLFSDRILQLVKHDIACLNPENIELAAEEIFFIIERYKSNEDVVELALRTLLIWTREKRNLAPLSRRGLGREVLALLRMPALRASPKFLRRTAVAGLQVLHALGSGSTHGARILSEGAVWATALSLLLEKPKIKGPELAALAAEAFNLVALAIKANQESAAMRLDPCLLAHQILAFALAHQQEASKEMVVAALRLVNDLMLLARIKGTQHYVLGDGDARQVLNLWFAWGRAGEATTEGSAATAAIETGVGAKGELLLNQACSATVVPAPEVVREVASLFSTALFLQKHGIDTEEDLASVLIQAGTVQRGLEALVVFSENTELLLALVPLLLRLGFSPGLEANIIREEVCHQLKAPKFLTDVTRYLERLEEKAQHADSPEIPMVFEKASSHRIDIQENGVKVMANGKGWVVGSAIGAGTSIVTYEILQEDKGDECSCLGISLVEDPSITAEYRSTGSPFITLRCFSGEIYRDSRVLHASEALKVHPGGVVRIFIDMEAGTMSFQVNDGPPVLVASDLKGRTIYPAAYFYLGEPQPDRSTHPIIRMSITGSQVAKTLAIAVDAALAFAFPAPLRALVDIAGRRSRSSSACASPLYQEGQIIRRRCTAVTTISDKTAVHEDPLFSAYCYGVGPGVTSGIHTYVFKASSILSICFGMVASDAVEPVLRLGPGPPEGIRTSLIVTLWSSGRVSSGGLLEGLRPVPYDAQDFVKADEPVTIRVRLEGKENVLEVVRGARVIHVVEQLDRRLPGGQALHPFVGLLSANDSVSVEYRVSSPVHALGSEGIPDRKAWTLKAQAALEELGQARCDSRTLPLQSPTRLSLPATFQYLEEATGPYKPISLLEELKGRVCAGGLKADVLSDIAWNICRSVSRGMNWESNVREKALQLLASLPQGLEGKALVVGNNAGLRRGDISENLGSTSKGSSNIGSGGFLVPAGALGLVVASSQDGCLTPGGLDLLTSLLGPPPCSPVFQAYARELGIVPLLLTTMEGGSSRPRDVGSGADPMKGNSDDNRSLDLLLLLLQGPAAPLEAIRSEVLSLGLFRTLLEHLTVRYINIPLEAQAFRRNHLQLIVELVAGKDWNQESLFSELLQMDAPVTAANPFLIRPHTLDEPASTAAMMTGAVATAPGTVLSPNVSTGPFTTSSGGGADILLQRHKATKLQEGWRGHVSQSGEASTSWQDAAFWALKDGDLDMLRVLLAAPYSIPFIADRVIFAPAWPGPWRGVLSEPVTMLGALMVLARPNQVEEMKAFLETRAQAYRRQKRENVDDKPSISVSQPSMSFLRHPNADGTLGTFAVDVQATEQFGFHHNDLVYAAAAPQWGHARVLGVQSKRLWLQFQGCLGAVTCPSSGWAPLDLRLLRARRDAEGSGTSTTFRLPLERGTRVVRGPHWEWGIQDAFAGNLGTVLGNGGGDGWYRVMWDTSHTSNSYQYMPEHQDISRYNDPLGTSLSSLFPSLPACGSDYVDGRELGEEGENVEVCESSVNVVTYAGEALANAGMDSLLALLHKLWPKAGNQWDDEEHVHQRHLLWICVSRLGLRNPARMAKIVEHPSAQPLVNAAIYQLQHPDGEQVMGHLFFLAVAARHGSNAILSAIEGALPYLLQLMAAPTSSTRAVVLSLSVMNSLMYHHRQGASVHRMVECNFENDHSALYAIMCACLQRVLLPTRENPHAAAHILAMRFLQSLFETDPVVLHTSKNEEEQLEQLQDEFVTLLETYATFAFPKTMIEELLLLLLAWMRATAMTDGGEIDPEKLRLAKERGAKVTLLARALLDEFEAANETLLQAPRQVLLSAPSILRRALTARKDISMRKRSVNLFLRAGTLGVLFQGDYEWTGAEAGHVLALCTFLQTLLEAAPGRKEDIITLPLMRDLMPVLLDTNTDLAVTKAILQTYVSRLPEEESITEPVVAATTADGRRGNWRGNSESGISSSRSGACTSTSSSSKECTFWTSLGFGLAHALCVTYKRVMAEQTTASLALTLLASVVQETRSLEQKDLEILLYPSPRSLPTVPASEVGAELGERYDDGAVAQIAAKLKIIGMACHSFETDAHVDTNALVVRVVQWLQAYVTEQPVVEAALHLLQLLVDSTHVLLPEQIIQSSGSLCTKSLFVAPPSSRHAPHHISSYPFSAPTLSSPTRLQRGVSASLGRQRMRRWHSSSEAVEELDFGMDEENDGMDGDEEAGARTAEEGSEQEPEEEGADEWLTDRTSMQGMNGASMYLSRMATMQDVAGGRVDNDGSELSSSPFLEEVVRAEALPTTSVAGANEEKDEGLNGAVPDQGGVEVAFPMSVSSEMDLGRTKPGWEPTGIRLPHWIQFHLPKEKRVGFGPATSVAQGAPPALMLGEAKALLQHWRALQLEQRDYQNNTPKVLEISVGRLSSGASLPLPASSLRIVRVIEQVNHRQTGWLSLVSDVELQEGEDVVQVLFSANFGADEVSTKTGRFRVLARTRISVEQIQAQLHMTELLPELVAMALAHAEDRSFLRTVTFFFRRFYPADTASLPALANSEYDLARGQAAGITFSEDGKWATFPFGPKLLVSTLNSSEGILRWVFRSSGNSSWAVGAIPASKIDRHDVMMTEQSLAVATTGLAGGRMALRKEIQKRNVEAVIDVQAGHLILTVENHSDSPILLPIPPDSQEPYHLAAMGYSNTVIQFLDKF